MRRVIRPVARSAGVGFSLGTYGTSAIFLVIILGLVIFLTTKQRQQDPALESG